MVLVAAWRDGGWVRNGTAIKLPTCL